MVDLTRYKYFVAEILTVLAGITGWSLVTWAVAEWAQIYWIYPLSLGIFLLGCVGWRLIFEIMLDGFYVLFVEGDDDGESTEESSS